MDAITNHPLKSSLTTGPISSPRFSIVPYVGITGNILDATQMFWAGVPSSTELLKENKKEGHFLCTCKARACLEPHEFERQDMHDPWIFFNT